MGPRLSIIVSVFALAMTVCGCASAPSHINDVCRVFDQKNGWFENWRSEANKTERKYGVPVPVLMATLRKESGFQHNAKPPRTMLLGIIPWKRVSSAYGYSQALDATWTQYQKETGHGSAKRNNFADAVDFVGWYHSKTSDMFGVKKDDAYSLYLAYYFGWNGYQRGDWQEKPGLQRYARETQKMAGDYAQQLQECN
jgi:hypothetical protein